MLRSVATKVAWVGRTASMVLGLAVVLALVFGALSVAAAHTGSAGLFHLGHNNNVSNALTKLTGNQTGAVLTADNNGTGPALALEVGTNRPPMTVNSRGKVANLNADRLDNLDSRALGVTTETTQQQTGECDTSLGGVNDCAIVQVKVPAGKTYHLTVFSSFTAESATSTFLTWCPSVVGSGVNTCLGTTNVIDLAANYAESGASQGDFTVGPGTYNVATNISPRAELVSEGNLNAKTTVVVRDASALGPPIN